MAKHLLPPQVRALVHVAIGELGGRFGERERMGKRNGRDAGGMRILRMVMGRVGRVPIGVGGGVGGIDFV